MHEQNVIYTKEQYTALERKDTPSHTTTWMSLEDAMRSEINQTIRTNTLSFHLYKAPVRVKPREMESSRVAARCWGKEDGELSA